MRRRRTSPPRSVAPETLEHLGIPEPLPFLGRETELKALDAALDSAHLVVVTGAAGSGKTALARQLLSRQRHAGSTRQFAYVVCEEGDLAEAVVARAERLLDVVPGSLTRALAATPRLLVIDELHRLSPDAAARLLGRLVRAGAIGRVIALSRDVLPLPREDAGRAEMVIDGLSADDARALWMRLEETWGPTPRGTVDAALERTRGVPLALRREFARAHDKKAWEVGSLPSDEKKLLCAASVLRVAATPAALAQLVPGASLEEGIRGLVRKQLLNPVVDGRLEVHDVVRAAALAGLTATERRSLEAGAAALLDDEDGTATAWEQVDGAALGVAEPLDRLREAVRHLAAAGKAERAAERLCASEALLARRGGGGEALAAIAQLAAAGVNNRQLELLRARLLARAGRVAEGLDAYETLERELGDKLDRVAPEARVAHAELVLASGDVEGATTRLRPLVDHIRPEVRAAALCAMASVDLERGQVANARKSLRALETAKTPVPPALRTRSRLLGALCDEREGRDAAARAALGRIAAAGVDGAEAAAVMAAQADALADEGRLDEAERLLGEAERAAREQDAPRLGDEIRRRAAMVAVRAGRVRDAEATLRELGTSARERGDETAALRAEIAMAAALVLRGRAAEGARTAATAAAAAATRGLAALAVEARLQQGLGELDELRAGEARDLLRTVIEDEAAPARVRAQAAIALVRAEAWLGQPAVLPEAAVDTLARSLAHAETLLAQGDANAALESLTRAAAEAARAGRPLELARALADAARLHLACGDRVSALQAASRAVTEAVPGGLDRAVARALLVRAALSRDEGDLPAAREHAAAALTVSRAAGLGPERYAAAAAAELCAREANDAAAVEPLIAQRSAAAATLGEIARVAADRVLADLGLTPARPFRLVSGAGSSSYVAEVDAIALKLERRSLVIDGSREQIFRSGTSIADLRRRSLLKRLLFLFAGAPGKSFTKEEIVQRVWGVDYHPLRHDAALFTNIMRLRRLLGEGGDEILRVGEGGYRLVPPADFMFVDKLAS